MTAILSMWAIVSVFMFFIMIILPELQQNTSRRPASSKKRPSLGVSRRTIETAQPQA